MGSGSSSESSFVGDIARGGVLANGGVRPLPLRSAGKTAGGGGGGAAASLRERGGGEVERWRRLA